MHNCQDSARDARHRSANQDDAPHQDLLDIFLAGKTLPVCMSNGQLLTALSFPERTKALHYLCGCFTCVFELSQTLVHCQYLKGTSGMSHQAKRTAALR